MEPAYLYAAKVVTVHDGDTYELDIDLGFRVRARLHVRLHGWSCPELKQPNGMEARDAALARLRDGTIVLQSYKDQQSFSRWVADIYVDGEHLGETLARMGLAQPGARVG